MIDQHPEEAPANQAQANEPQAQDGPTRARDRVPLFIRRLDWKLIGTILAIKALFYWYGTQAYQVLTNSSIGSFKNWLALWNRWDAVHYVTLAENGYQATGEARFLIVFYPLFPWLTRIAALIFRNYVVSALIVVAGHQYWATRKWRWQWLWIGLVGVGVLSYLFLNYRVHGNPFMFMTYRREHWFQVMSWPWIGVKEKFLMAWHGTGEGGVITGTQDLLFLILGFAATIWSFIKLRPSYAVWMIGNWLLFTSTTFIIGVARFTVIMFPLFILFSLIASRRSWHRISTVWSLFFLAFFTGLYVEGHWVF